MNKEELSSKCLELGFTHFFNDRLDSFGKQYNTCYLLIAERKDGLFDSHIEYDGIEILLPILNTIDWVIEFDELNKD